MYAHDKLFVRRFASFNVIPRSYNKKPTFAKIVLATRETRRMSFKKRHEKDMKRDWKDIFVDEETKTRFVNCLYSFTIPSPFLPFLVREAVQRAFSRKRVLLFNFEEEAYEARRKFDQVLPSIREIRYVLREASERLSRSARYPPIN